MPQREQPAFLRLQPRRDSRLYDLSAIDDGVSNTGWPASQPCLNRIRYCAGVSNSRLIPDCDVSCGTHREGSQFAGTTEAGSPATRCHLQRGARCHCVCPVVKFCNSRAWRASNHIDAESADDEPSTQVRPGILQHEATSPERYPTTKSGWNLGSAQRQLRQRQVG